MKAPLVPLKRKTRLSFALLTSSSHDTVGAGVDLHLPAPPATNIAPLTGTPLLPPTMSPASPSPGHQRPRPVGAGTHDGSLA